MKISNFKLGIGRPCSFEMVHLAFFDSMIQLERPPFIYLPVDRGTIDQMREQMAVDALKVGCSHLFMMDCDMTYHPQTITKLLSHDLPIVGALCYRRYPPFDSLAFRKNGDGWVNVGHEKEDGLIKIHRTGAGCLMIQTQVFDKISRPWFDLAGPNKKMDEAKGEDYRFCDKAIKAGFEIFVDPTIPADHLATFKINKEFSDLYQRIEKSNEAYLAKLTGGKEHV